MKRKVLVIGGGSIGERHVRCFQKTGLATVGLCEINPAVRESVAERYELEGVFDELDAGMDWKPDAAVICTPASLHIPMALKLAEAGIHLLIEKPLSTTTTDINRLASLVATRSLAVSVAYVYRAHPAMQAMRAAIQSRRFGSPVQVVAVSGQHFPLYRPAYREIYYRDRAMGGGAIQDALTHVVNGVEWLVGPITRLAADAEHCVLEGVEVEDTVQVIARHGSVLASYSLNQHQAPNESSITVICTNGTCRFEMHRHRWLYASEPGAEWQEAESFSLERDDLFIRQAAQFLELLDGRTEPACTLSEAAQTLRVNLGILEAAESREWVVI